MYKIDKYSIEAFLDNSHYSEYGDHLKWNECDNVWQLKKSTIKNLGDLARGRNRFQAPALLKITPVYTKYGIRYEFAIEVESYEIKINSEKIIRKNLQYIQNKLPKGYSSLIKRILSEYICFLCKPLIDDPVLRKTYGWVIYPDGRVEYFSGNVTSRGQTAVFFHRDPRNVSKHMEAFLCYIKSAPTSVKKIFSFALTSIDYKSPSMRAIHFPDAGFCSPALCLYGKGFTAAGEEITKAEVASLFLDFTKTHPKIKGSITSHAPHFTLNSLKQKEHTLPMYGDIPIITRSNGGCATESSTALNKLLLLQQYGWVLGQIVVLNEKPVYLDQFVNVDISDIHDIAAVDPACVETAMAEYIKYLTMVLQEHESLKETYNLDYDIHSYRIEVIDKKFIEAYESFEDEKYDGNKKGKYIDLTVSLERFGCFMDLFFPKLSGLFSEIKDGLISLYRDEALYREGSVPPRPAVPSSPTTSLPDNGCKQILNDVLVRYKKKYGNDFPMDKTKHRFILRNEFCSLFHAAYPNIKYNAFIHQCLELKVFKGNKNQLYFDRVVNGEKKQALVFDKFEF